MSFAKKVFSYRVLFYYALLFSTILAVGGWVAEKDVPQIVANILFLPVPIYLWSSLFKNRKKAI